MNTRINLPARVVTQDEAYAALAEAQLAISEADRTGRVIAMRSSAVLCASDAVACIAKLDFGAAVFRASESVRYSEGAFSPRYARIIELAS